MSDIADANFRWPEKPYPPPSWWEVAGAELGLEPPQIKFAAALVQCGGPDSRNNSLAARLAGLEMSRTEAFRLARSVKVRRLINNAEDIRSGKHEPITEQEIDQRIDRMIRNANDQWAARGIELHERRVERRRQEQGSNLTDIREELRLLYEIAPELASAYAAEKGIADWSPPKERGRQCSSIIAPT